MRLIYARQGVEIALEENRVSTLLIENPVSLCEMLQSLLRQMEGDEGEWILSDSDIVLPLAKSCVFIDNPLMVDCNEKRIITKLYKELVDHAKSTINVEGIKSYFLEAEKCVIIDKDLCLIKFPAD